MSQTPQYLSATVQRYVKIPYLLFLPEGYHQDPRRRWPMILFLHGAGERGNDLSLLKKHGIPKIVETQPDFPFVTISPQCPPDDWWPNRIDDLQVLLDRAMATYRVDPHRIYLTGLSMGGYGSWSLALRFPDRFAAVVPICGGLWGSPPQAVQRLKDVPIWVFHGAKDPVVPLAESKRLVEALQQVDGKVRFTIYPDAEHDAWTRTYANPALYEWLLEHTLP